MKESQYDKLEGIVDSGKLGIRSTANSVDLAMDCMRN